jgi:type II secretory pathway component GspD/PulD (secretin)
VADATATNVTTTTVAVTVTNTTVVAVDTNAAAAAPTVTTNTTLAVTSDTNAPAVAPNVIPLIQFSDVPITTAIENLARQAGINYMLDPKIGYGQPDANGQIKPEPQLSIRWENITAESALLALLDNYGLQLIVDKRTGIDRVALKDPLAPPVLITRVIQLQYASVSNMTEAVQSVLGDKRSRVIPDNRTSQLLVVATDQEQQAVDTLVAQLDKQTKQVLIETKLVEISSAPSTTRGVDWSATLSQQHVTFGNGIVSGVNNITTPGGLVTKTITTPGGGHTKTTGYTPPANILGTLTQTLGGSGWSAATTPGILPATAFLNADGVEAVLSFLNSSFDAQVYSTPRVVTLDNQLAHIEVIRTFPILNITGGTQNSQGSASVTYSNIGTILDVTPRISANDNIFLNVTPEVSSHFGDETVTQPGGGGNPSTSFSIPIFDRRRIVSQVMIPNGNTLVMGGLVQDNPNATYTKVPFLGDIPGLGWAFHSESKNMTKDNLIIFLTPTIVRDDDFQPTSSSFLQSKPRTMGQPMNPHQPWDGAEPRVEHDWNNPAPMPGEFNVQPLK